MTPYPYQWEGALTLAAHRRFLLMDGMRVGKTMQAVVGTDLIAARNVLVVCPGLARSVWARHFDKASLMGLPVAIVWSKDDAIEPEGVTIISMDGARQPDIHARLMEHQWDVLIVDEQHFLNNRGSQRTQAVLGAKGLAGKAKRIWFLTGTPMLNSPADLWVVLRTIGVWKEPFDAFLNRFCDWYPGEFGPVVKKAKNADELKRLMAPVTLRRTWKEVKHQVSDNPAPDPIWHDVALEFSSTPENDDWVRRMVLTETAPRIAKTLKEWLAAAEDDRDMSKMSGKQNVAAQRRAVALVKVKPIVDWLVPKLASREIEKCVIFAHHSYAIELLHGYLKPFGSKTIYGPTPEAKRTRNIEMFNDRWNRQVLICQDQLARQAVDLSGANHLIFAEMDWVPENNAQAAMRIQGPLQIQQPHIWTMQLKGSTDEAVMRVCARKTKMWMELFA